MVGIGIIGSGVGIRTHVPGFIQTDRAELVALYSPNSVKAKVLGARHGFRRVHESYQELCADTDVDLVVVASPNSFHFVQVKEALERGKHVLCEKPLSGSIEECEALADLASARCSQITVVNHQLRYNPYFKELKRIISSGELGSVFHARIFQQGNNGSDRSAPWSWSFDSDAGGGVRWAMGSHLVDLSTFLLGSAPAVVFGGLHTVVPVRYQEELPVDVNTSLEFSGAMMQADGANVFISAVTAGHSGFKFEIDVYMEHGQAHFDLDSKLTIYRDRGSRVDRLKEIPDLKPGELDNTASLFSGSFRYYADELLDAIVADVAMTPGGAPTFVDALATTRVLDAFLRSYRTGESVQLSVPEYDRSSV